MSTAQTPENKDVYTTGEVAAICRCAPRTVVKWCNTGALRHRTLAGSRDRRIDRAALIEFMRNEQFVESMIPSLDGASAGRVFTVAIMASRPDEAAVASVNDALRAKDGMSRVFACSNWYQFGNVMAAQNPHVGVIIVEHRNDPSLRAFVEKSFDHTKQFRKHACVAVVPASITAGQCQQMVKSGEWHAVYRRPFQLKQLIEWLTAMQANGAIRIQQTSTVVMGNEE